MGILKNSFKGILLLLCLIIAAEVSSKPPLYKEFTINNGLPHTDANCTVQDNKGFLWFATLDGLCRYDGSDMIIYRNDHFDPNSISNNRISILEFDSQRNGLWIGTQGGGLNFLDLATGRFHKLNIENNGRVIKEVVSLKVLGRTLVVSTPNGLFEAAITTEKPYVKHFYKVNLGQDRIVEAIYQDKNQGIWVGTLNELFYKAPGKGNYIKIHEKELSGIYAITKYDDHHILAGTLGGLYKIDLRNFKLDKLNNLKVMSLLTDQIGSIWVGTISEGLFHCKADGTADQSYPFGSAGEKRKNIVKNIFKDRSSSIFVSTLGGGIKVISLDRNTFKSYPQNVTDEAFAKLKRPLCFFGDQSEWLYIGTRKNGLAVYNRVSEEVEFYDIGRNESNSLTGQDVTSVFKDSKGKLWVGKGDGLYVFNSKDLIRQTFHTASFKYIPNAYGPFRINKIIEDKRFRIWAVTSKGLFCYNESGKLIFTTNQLQKKYLSLHTDYLNDILLKEEDHGSTLVIWMATKSGISRLKLNNDDYSVRELKKFTAGPGSGRLFSNWISLLHEDKNHDIWAGTIGGGLSQIIQQKDGRCSFSTITTHDGLLTNDVETLLEDQEGNFWIGGLGLTKYHPVHKTFSYYDANDGLQSNAFKVWAAFKYRNGEMIFGGINGFNIFNPKQIIKTPRVFTPQLTNLIISNITVKPGSKVEGQVILQNALPYTSAITLNHKIRNFGLEFASIHSNDFRKIVYRYRLVGYDREWTYTNSKKRFVNYTGLPPGDYVFQLSASGGEGIWNSRPLMLNIHIIPSFWESIYGYILYGVLILGALFLMRRYTLIRLDIKHKLQIDKARQEQEIKSYEDKVQFFTNVSHELRTPLTLITTPVEQLVNHADTPRLICDKLTVVHKNAERLRSLIDQILDLRKLELGKITLNKENVKISNFLNNIFVQFLDLAEKKNISFLIHTQSSQNLSIDVFKMEQVLINLFSNAIKFTPENGKVAIDSFTENNQLIIRICNSGALLSVDEQSKVFDPFYQAENGFKKGTGLGLTISKYLVELHEGVIEAKSHIDSESRESLTCFTIKLPVPNEVILEERQTENDPVTLPLHEHADETSQRLAIVIIDDNDELRTILKDEFSSDYKIYEAANGREGLKIIRRVKPALVITDVMMPDIDGITLCKSLKGDIATIDVPVIMLTAKGTEMNRIEGLEAMADDYITKPFNLKELRLKVKNIISQMASLKVKLNNEAALKPAVLNYMARDERILKEVIAIIEDNIDNPDFTVEQLCRETAVSRPVLYRKIKELTGMSIQIFILDIRLKRAAQLLSAKCFSVSEVMYKTGFSSPSYFNKAFKKKYHLNPTHYHHELQNQ